MIPAPKFRKPYAALFLGFLAIITFIGLFSTPANAAYYGGGYIYDGCDYGIDAVVYE
jgi:hypothetical protein